ncbi:MAG TPA: exostosin family protein, partial [Roseimicrobium sp.]|nr:exostosin family protein [Roseimicrobium sp.]
SAFVLCPRGVGSGSVRLFEVMQMARAPVIVSDLWVPPTGPKWDSFSIRVAEKDVGKIPSILRSRCHEAESMGRAARAAYDEWFSPTRRLQWLVGRCLAMKSEGMTAAPFFRLSLRRHYLEAFHFRNRLRLAKNLFTH